MYLLVDTKISNDYIVRYTSKNFLPADTHACCLPLSLLFSPRSSRPWSYSKGWGSIPIEPQVTVNLMLMYDKVCMTDIITLINTQSHNSCKFNIPTVHFTCTVIQYTSHVRLSISTVHFTCKVVHIHIACTVIIYHIYKHIISIRVSVTVRERTFHRVIVKRPTFESGPGLPGYPNISPYHLE